MIQHIAAIVAPVFICTLIGYGWSKSGQPFNTGMVSELVAKIGAPALIFSSLEKVSLSLGQFLDMALYCVLVLSIVSLLSVIGIKLLKQDLRTYYATLTFANVGNMGLPLCLMAFGNEGLALAIAFFMINSVGHFSLGLMSFSGKSFSKTFFHNPIIISVFLALVFLVSDLSLPIWLFNSVDLIGGFTIPLMLITLGVSLSQLHIDNLKIAIIFSTLRLLLGFTTGLFVTMWFGLEGVERGVVLIMSSMPVAIFNYLFALQYQRNPQAVAGTVVISTLISCISLPALIAFVI